MGQVSKRLGSSRTINSYYRKLADFGNAGPAIEAIVAGIAAYQENQATGASSPMGGASAGTGTGRPDRS